MRHAREDYNRFQDPEGLIPQDEPVFLLRGQDEFAPQTLLFYANNVEQDNPEMARIVRNWAEEMLKWQDEVKVKSPDLK